MKKVLLMVALVGLLAGPALADPVVRNINAVATAYSLDSAGGPRVDTVVYSNMVLADNYSVALAAGTRQADDYQAAASTSPLTSFRFVGGVAVANTSLYFNYYATAADVTAYNYIGYVGVTLPSAGNYIWNITLSTPLTDVPQNGYWEMEAATGATGRWFLNVSAPTVGATTAYPGYTHPTSGLPMDFKFELTTPEPATLALLAVGALALIRRR